MQLILLKYQKILGLLDWDITLQEVPTLENDGQTKILYNMYKALVQIKDELSMVEKEKTLIHELLHLIFRDAHDIAQDNIENKYLQEYYTRQHERAIEKTAQILYASFDNRVIK